MGQNLETEELPPVPGVDAELREIAELAAEKILKCGGWIPKKIGLHVREINLRKYVHRYINAFYHLSTCKYLRSLDAGNSPAKDHNSLVHLKYLQTLKVGRYMTYGSVSGGGPTKYEKRKHWDGIGTYEIDQNPLYRRFGKKRDKPLPACTNIEWLAKLKQLKKLSIEVHDVSDLTPLSELENLEILKLHGAKSTSLRMISQLPNLKELELYNCTIDDLSALVEVKNLTILKIKRCDVGLLAKLPKNLKYFDLSKSRVKDVIFPKDLPDLLRFYFGGWIITGKLGSEEEVVGKSREILDALKVDRQAEGLDYWFKMEWE